MWKYVLAFVVVFGLTVFVSYQTQQIAEQDARQTAPTTNGAAAPNPQNNQALEIPKIPKQNTPFWLHFFFQLFTWPEGVTAWAILLTLFAIAEQTQQTRKAAEAASISAEASNAQIQVMQTQAGHMERQSKILEDSVAAAQKAADAAKISADVAAGLSVPALVIHDFGAGDVGTANVEAFFQRPKIKIAVKNYGQTPAILKWFCICCTCEELPDVPIYEGPGSGIVLEKIVIQPGAEYTLSNLMSLQRQEFSLEDVKAIVNREKLFCAYGYICYGDTLGNPLRRLKFCETVLNIFGGEAICDWHEGLAPSAYAGIDLLPTNRPSQKKPENPS